jgi:tetratricopeptide (TPR) repeat protein
LDLKTVFKDSPGTEEMKEAIARWKFPEMPAELTCRFSLGSRSRFYDLSNWYRETLAAAVDFRLCQGIEKNLIVWLYDFIRLNVKRGRIYNLCEVLRTGDADCLGYAKLFATLGRQCGLDAGVVEIVVDNRGRNVPHTGSLARLADGKRQFIDFWYGSTNIRHKRLGLRVKRQGAWNIEDIDFPDIKKAEDTGYLPDDVVDAIMLYIQGNISLNEGKYDRAVGQYSRAIALYPQNARIFYNRAIAYEKLGLGEKAEADYSRALQDTAALMRTLATQPQDVVDLIKLDRKYVPAVDQQIYLLHKGFITGRPVTPAQIAGKLAIPLEDVEVVLDFVVKVLD